MCSQFFQSTLRYIPFLLPSLINLSKTREASGVNGSLFLSCGKQHFPNTDFEHPISDIHTKIQSQGVRLQEVHGHLPDWLTRVQTTGAGLNLNHMASGHEIKNSNIRSWLLTGGVAYTCM